MREVDRLRFIYSVYNPISRFKMYLILIICYYRNKFSTLNPNSKLYLCFYLFILNR